MVGSLRTKLNHTFIHLFTETIARSETFLIVLLLFILYSLCVTIIFLNHYNFTWKLSCKIFHKTTTNSFMSVYMAPVVGVTIAPQKAYPYYEREQLQLCTSPAYRESAREVYTFASTNYISTIQCTLLCYAYAERSMYPVRC